MAPLVEKAELQGVELYSGSQGLSSLLERSDIQALVVDVHMQLMVSKTLWSSPHSDKIGSMVFVSAVQL